MKLLVSTLFLGGSSVVNVSATQLNVDTKAFIPCRITDRHGCPDGNPMHCVTLPNGTLYCWFD